MSDDYFETHKVLYRKTGENFTTPPDPVCAFVEGVHADLLGKKAEFCVSSDNDQLVSAPEFEVHEVTLPTWLDPNEWARDAISWKYLWGAGVPTTWPESWQRGLLGLSMAQKIAAVGLLKTQDFRSEFRKSLTEQLKTWLEKPETRKYAEPLSARQWEVLLRQDIRRKAERLSSQLYRDRFYRGVF